MRVRFFSTLAILAAFYACDNEREASPLGVGVGAGQGGGADSAAAPVGSNGQGNDAGAGGAREAGTVPAMGGTLGSDGSVIPAGTGGVSDAGGTPAAGMFDAGRRPDASSDADGGGMGMGGSDEMGPCDIYAMGGTPCVAAHSTVRALYRMFSGNLYQVKRASDNTTKDIGVVTPGGVANAATQDAFCTGTTCVITILYDQSGKGNKLEYQGEGSSVGGRAKAASATGETLNVHGNKVYALYINPGNSYWRDGSMTGIPTGSAPEGMYMVTSGTHVNGGCCFDYGNSETTRKADGAGAMDAIYFGTSCWFGGCSGTGPWVQADLEYGLFPGGSQTWNANQKAFTNKYVTAMLKNDGTTRFALKGGNAQSGNMMTLWDGALPRGYSPMRKQGAIILGSGGDCCATNTNLSQGTFYEGAMVSGYPSDATEALIQENIIAAGYGK